MSRTPELENKMFDQIQSDLTSDNHDPAAPLREFAGHPRKQ